MAEFETALASGDVAAIMAVVMAMLAIIFVVALVAYVYYALVFMTLAKKLKYDKPWLAWVPVANLFLMPILAKKHWAMGFLLLIPIVNIVFVIIWHWAIFERRKYPGWLSLIAIGGIIPYVGFLAMPAWAIILGIVAWVDR